VRTPEWPWNEFQQVGTDYADIEQVAKYDARMATFRDVETENRRISRNPGPSSEVLRLGDRLRNRTLRPSGRRSRSSGHGIDVSPVMLEYVVQKAAEEGLTNLETQHAGFLTMDLPADHFDAVVSVVCLHHLPDLWKLVGPGKRLPYPQAGWSVLPQRCRFLGGSWPACSGTRGLCRKCVGGDPPGRRAARRRGIQYIGLDHGRAAPTGRFRNSVGGTSAAFHHRLPLPSG
jgi:SAM-dependent methyltransferase